MSSRVFLVLLLCLASIRPYGVEPRTAEAEQHYVIGLSPFLEKNGKDEVFRRIISLLLESAPLNSVVSLYDAYNLRTIAQVQVPNVSAFKSAKTRANQFKEPIQKLRDFLAATNLPPVDAGGSRLSFQNTVRLPQFLDFVADNISRGTNAVRLILLCSPLYMDAKEPKFSMVDGYFPSDGHLAASRQESVFGLKDRSEALEGCSVYFGYFGDPWVSDLHREKIARFWSLFLDLQGGRLATFAADLPTVFGAAIANSGVEKSYRVNSSETKIEMLRISRDVEIADWITRDVLQGETRPPSITRGPMKIGIRWRGNIDLDLYAKPGPRGQTLYFEHTRIPEGYYFKDHRSSPDREYEFIEFESPVDVWEANASINFYEGRSPGGASGEIRIEFDGKIYTSRFALPADRGNRGRDDSRQRDFWTRVDIPEILHLERRSALENQVRATTAIDPGPTLQAR